MVKRMLIDATHPEETRVVVQSGNRLEDFDYETTSKKQLKGNIYLAKITRVEPSLQAAFVDYGGNRHGFLPFSEIHPDYYRIPIADREALLAEEAAKAEEEEPAEESDQEAGAANGSDAQGDTPEDAAVDAADGQAVELGNNGNGVEAVEEVPVESDVDTVGGDEIEEAARRRAKLLRRYKIQEVIKRRQIILVQVAKEERGNKGAALTTYLSLAGRYCVLMPNTNKGGGISRKISNAGDRRRLKQVLGELKIPEGIAVIVRTAGSRRSKAEIRRDYEYLMRLWNEIRETTLNSTAPCLIYEEANLIKRAIRDLYSSDMDEIQVEGDAGYKAAKAFMKSLMPSHAKKVQLFKDDKMPLYQRYQVEPQLDAMHSSTVRLRSGGYIVLNPTEALVAIDVNSGKATRERHIEETALKTNLEAAEEVGRQLRLRDLAGLIVIDFIDMEESRHNREVERKLKEALRHDRARIQLGRISPFGLLEMSRQRLRPSLFESSHVICSRCLGSGYVRTVESSALHVLRGLEEEAIRRGGGMLRVAVAPDVALYILNQKRYRLIELEQRHDLKVEVASDEGLVAPEYKLERLSAGGVSRPVTVQPEEAAGREEEDGERKRGRRRRQRRREEPARATAEAGDEAAETSEPAADDEEMAPAAAAPEAEGAEDRPRKRRRRGRRGGRRRARGEAEPAAAADVLDEEEALLEASPHDDLEEPAAAQDDDAADEGTPSADAGETEAPAAAEAAPKRRRAPRRKKPKAEGEAEVEAPVEAASEDVEAIVAPEEPVARPKRQRAARGAKSAAGKRPRKKKDEASEGAAAEPEAPPVMPPQDDDVARQPEEPAVPAAAAAAPPPGGAEDAAEQPKRRGWWSRLV